MRARISSGTNVPREVGLVGLLAAVSAGYPRARVDGAAVGTATEPVVPRTHGRPDRVGQHPRVGLCELAHRVDPERGQPLADLGADPPQRGGGPLAHHLEPLGLGESRPRTRSRRPLAGLAEDAVAILARHACVVTACPRPASAGSAVAASTSRVADVLSKRRRGSPQLAVPPPPEAPRKASSQPSTSTTTGTPPHSSPRRVAITPRRGLVVRRPVDGQEDGVRIFRAAIRSGMPEPTPCSRAA